MVTKEILQFLNNEFFEVAYIDKGITTFKNLFSKNIIITIIDDNYIITNSNKNRDTECGYFHHQLFEGKIETLDELKLVFKLCQLERIKN